MVDEVFLAVGAVQNQGVLLECSSLRSLCRLNANVSLSVYLNLLSNSPGPNQPGKTGESFVEQVARLEG